MKSSKLGYEKVKGEYVKTEADGFTLYIRSDMRFEGGIPLIDRRDYRGVSYLLVRNALED
ncbi:hypothetical protein [uncultured Fretibacterium sp.]|uniref:hypothetical protein n=1 Tax=uncultured Fretibacterium sp. TaxID=1678694 RepID=UPI00262DA133|nr:hypothetical protein [uncultured Fretibacterium sp.]